MNLEPLRGKAAAMGCGTVLIELEAAADRALLSLLSALGARGYTFTTPTPATHARVVARPLAGPPTLRDIFGWSRGFREANLDMELLAALSDSGMCVASEGELKSAVRVASLGDDLLLHSAYPTDAADAVFFGPDSYRFARFVAEEIGRCAEAARGRIVDIGAGNGAGGLVAARLCPGAPVLLTDVNAKALRLARVNAAFAGVAVETLKTNGLDGVDGDIALALANPPYLVDEGERAYRHGGGRLGAQLSLDLAAAAMARLVPGGRLLLYTGSAIVGGRDALRDALADLAADAGCDVAYREIDPDVFGEELERPAYAEAERIAAVGAVVTKR